MEFEFGSSGGEDGPELRRAASSALDRKRLNDGDRLVLANLRDAILAVEDEMACHRCRGEVGPNCRAGDCDDNPSGKG
jgi:hypothetical protein